MIDCFGVPAGIQSLACLSAEANYLPGYIFLVLLISILFFSLARDAPRERMAAVMLVVAVVTAIGSVEQVLFPSHFFVVSAVLFIGSVGMLKWRT